MIGTNEPSLSQPDPQSADRTDLSNRRAFLIRMTRLGVGGLALAASFTDVLTTDSMRSKKKPESLNTLQTEAYNWIKAHYNSNFNQSNTAFNNLNTDSFGFGPNIESTLGITNRQDFSQATTKAMNIAITGIGEDIRSVYSRFYGIFTYPTNRPFGGYKVRTLSATGIPHIAVWAFARNFIPIRNGALFDPSRYYHVTADTQHIIDIVERNFEFAASGQIDLKTGTLDQDLSDTMFQLYGALGISRDLTDTATYIKLGYLIPLGDVQLLTNRQGAFANSEELVRLVLSAYASLPEDERVRIKKEFYSSIISEALNALLSNQGLREQFAYYTDDMKMLIQRSGMI